jgi:hypothetical protein
MHHFPRLTNHENTPRGEVRSATDMMPRTLPTLLAISLLAFCGVAAAGPLDVAAQATASVDARADLTGVRETADGAAGAAHATLDAASDAKDKVQAEARADADASTGAAGGIVAGVQDNLHAFGAWIHGLFGSGSANAQAAADGSAVDLASSAQLDANVPAPPQPDVGFVGKVQAGLAAIFHLG